MAPPESPTRAKALAAGRDHLRQAGIEAADEDARLLLLDACKIDRLALVTGDQEVLSAPEAARYRDLIARRAKGEPASRILGRRPFWTLDLEVRPGVLDPRGDTEALVRLALRTAATPRRVLDLGCGSGALLCATLSEWQTAFGVGVDLSPHACAATSANLRTCALDSRAAVLQGTWCDALTGPFDLVLSNPPYIPSRDLAGLDREVRDHDPPLALDGGADGLDAYRAIFGAAPRVTAPSGVLAVEFGYGQAEGVERIAAEAGWRQIDAEQDISGRARAAAFRLDPKESIYSGR